MAQPRTDIEWLTSKGWTRGENLRIGYYTIAQWTKPPQYTRPLRTTEAIDIQARLDVQAQREAAR